MSDSHFRVLVCGSRDYEDKHEVYTVLDQLWIKTRALGKHLLIISGGATGADTLAQNWAIENRIDHLIFYARWETEGKAAGPLRNKRMADKGRPHLVIAFSKNFATSRGTANMVGVAEKKGIKVEKHG